jgi:iron(III) transport system substrate-binding protein
VTWPARLPARVLALALMLGTLCLPARAGPPDGYPSNYGAIVSAARDEGKVVVYSTTDASAVAALIRDFELAYPGVKVDYNDLNSAELHNRYLAETLAKRPSADVLWSSAMDLQIKLANDNFAARYRSPEAPSLPEWAVWRDEAFGTTFEPAVFVYSKRFVTGADIPQTHADFLKLITTQRDKYAGNVTTYDVTKSAVGFLFATQDSRVQGGFWDLVKALGANAVELESSTSVMVQRIAAGKDYLGYNLIGSYALTRARRDPSIGVVLPKDYTLVMSRIALLSKTASHPNAARLWLDYLLSRRGQTVLSSRSELFSIRGDVAGEFTAATLRQTLGTSLKAITVGPALLVFLDQSKQGEFLRRWGRETGTVK